MYKKIVSLWLVLLLSLSVCPVLAESSEVIVYLSVSQCGEIVKDKNGNDMACAKVHLSAKTGYTLDVVFTIAHEMYYPEGASGYASSRGNWGLGVDKLWGDTSYNFGYQVNGGTESVMGPDHSVEDGDYVDAVIYQNEYPDTEGYSTFDAHVVSTIIGETITLTLSYVSGYDESFSPVFSPCADATITINGEEAALTTDDNGCVSVGFENEGRYIISAQKTKNVEDINMPAIAAPVCVVTVMHPAVRLMHNIAKRYAESNLEEAGGNLSWILADMAIYEKVFPDSENILTEKDKKEALEYLATVASQATKPGDLAKYILAFRALGYDAKRIYTKDFEKIDLVSRLMALVDGEDEGVVNIYTLPYVILALRQHADYANEEQINALLAAALDSKEAWQNTDFGTDGLTPMILALSHDYGTNAEVESVVDESISILLAKQREDGVIDGFEGYEPASTGLAICALSAIGYDAQMLINGGKNMMEGLLLLANEEYNGFSNAFATEQSFRGLLAWELLRENSDKPMYDFSDAPMHEANMSPAQNCPVVFDVTPSAAKVFIDGAIEYADNCYDLAAGVYEYEVSTSRYVTESGEIEVSLEEAAEHVVKTISVNLSPRYSGGGGGSIFIKHEDNEKTETPPDEKNEQIEPEIPKESIIVENVFHDVQKEDWFYPAVQYVYEKQLFKGTDNGFEPNLPMTRAMLVTVLHRLEKPALMAENQKFTDVSNDAWYAESVAWAAENQIVNGVSDVAFMPEAHITREQLAVILYRYATFCDYHTTQVDDAPLERYIDLELVSNYAQDAMAYALATGVLNGRTDNTLEPNGHATRAEVAAMLMRFAEVEG